MEMTIVTHFLDDEMKREGHTHYYYDNLIQKEIQLYDAGLWKHRAAVDEIEQFKGGGNYLFENDFQKEVTDFHMKKIQDNLESSRSKHRRPVSSSEITQEDNKKKCERINLINKMQKEVETEVKRKIIENCKEEIHEFKKQMNKICNTPQVSFNEGVPEEVVSFLCLADFHRISSNKVYNFDHFAVHFIKQLAEQCEWS